ncbi:hypothetical protein KAR91_63195, partial [Candidatus Pacearchaeota archaeon]|nr:hypothetical protein [Candidatus Pacearchaeota archaeon]
MKKFIIVLCCLLFLVPSISHGVDYLVEDFDDWSYNHAMQSGDCGGYPGCKYYPADGFPSSSIPEASEWQNGNAGGSLGYCWVNPAAGECYGGSGKCYWHTWPGVSNSGDGFIHGYFGERDEIYIRYYSKLKDTSWSSSWGPTTGWKLFWLYATNYGQFCRVNFLKRFYHSKDAYALYVYAQGSYEVDTESFGYLSIVPTDWNCYEHQFKMNDVGQNNGIYRLWFNGVLTIEDTSVTYRNSSNQHFYKMEVMANAKVPTGPTSPAYDGGAMKEYMDELIISDSYIGPLGDDVTAPTLDSKVIAANGTTLTLGFSENANKGSGYSDADHNLDCSVTGNNIGLTYDSGDGTATWECIIASTIQDGETCNYDFDGDIEDDSGNDLEEIIDGSVTNNSTQGVDETPPATSGWSPEKSATGVDVDEDIEFHITDSGDGVDGTTIELIVEGVTYCCTDGSCANKTLSRSGTAADYTITYVHASWGYSQEINVSIDADDLASSPNSMTTDTYSFTTEAENDPPTPNPMEWYVPAGAPAEIEDPSALDMVAADASDVSLPIEYKF